MRRRLAGLWRRPRREGVHPPLGVLLGDDRDPMVLLAPGVDERAVRRRGLPERAVVRSLAEPVAPPGERDTVVLVAEDLTSLRRAVTGLRDVGRVHRVVVWLLRDASRLPVPLLHPMWPAADEVVSRRSPDPVVMIRFSAPVPARQVLLHLARAAAPSGRLAGGWPTVGVRRQVPADWPPADPSATVAVLPRLLQQSVDFPPDLVLAGPSVLDRDDLPTEDHPILGRPSQVQVVEPELTWGEWQELSAAGSIRALEARGIESLRPVDEHVVNPIGFERRPSRRVAPLGGGPDARLSVAVPGAAGWAIDTDRGVGDADLPVLRPLAGVRLDWAGGRGPQAYCRVVAGLAMAGVPLVSERVPEWAGRLLAPDLVTALGRPVDLDDRLAREEHSVALRRAALHGHATGPWRQRLAARHGLQQASEPRVSVLLATRRPEMLPFALRQVARQRGASVELVLAAHGFDPDPGVLDDFRRASSAPLSVLVLDSSVSFGEVLNRAAAAATGDLLLKMDDDDWYGPDFVADLLLARHYSGAQVVGCPPEFTYLAELDATTRGAQTTEAYRHVVAGGTMLVDRGLFRDLGGFRHTARYVDAGLLGAASRAGAVTYGTHGLGYVLRRERGGHTWDPGLDYFLEADRAAERWQGFRPSALLDPADEDLPRLETSS